MERTDILNTLIDNYIANLEPDHQASSLMYEALRYSKEDSLSKSEDAINKLMAHILETAWKAGFKEAFHLMAELYTLNHHK